MLKKLRELQMSRALASLYGNASDTQKFMYGRVLRADEDWTALLLVHPNGNYDGIVCLSTDRVYRVETGGRYGEKMRRLLQFDPVQMNVALEGGDPVAATLALARDTGKIVSLELEDSGLDDVSGFVDSMSGWFCTIRSVNEYGEPEGTSTVALNSVTRVACDTEDEQRLLRLYNAIQSEEM